VDLSTGGDFAQHLQREALADLRPLGPLRGEHVQENHASVPFLFPQVLQLETNSKTSWKTRKLCIVDGLDEEF
jgi:hypothetical protein